jgi:hypothetical protein
MSEHSEKRRFSHRADPAADQSATIIALPKHSVLQFTLHRHVLRDYSCGTLLAGVTVYPLFMQQDCQINLLELYEETSKRQRS